MAASPTKQQITRKLRYLNTRYPENRPYVVLRASNGEVAILPKAYVDSFTPKKENT